MTLEALASRLQVRATAARSAAASPFDDRLGAFSSGARSAVVPGRSPAAAGQASCSIAESRLTRRAAISRTTSFLSELVAEESLADPDVRKFSSPRRRSRTRPALQSSGRSAAGGNGVARIDSISSASPGPGRSDSHWRTSPRRASDSNGRRSPVNWVSSFCVVSASSLLSWPRRSTSQRLGFRGGRGFLDKEVELMSDLGRRVPVALSTGPAGPLQVREIRRQHRTSRLRIVWARRIFL